MLTTHTLSLNDQSASLEVKREGGAQGLSITKEPQLIGCMENRVHIGYSASVSQCGVAVCEWLVIIKEEQQW